MDEGEDAHEEDVDEEEHAEGAEIDQEYVDASVEENFEILTRCERIERVQQCIHTRLQLRRRIGEALHEWLLQLRV